MPDRPHSPVAAAPGRGSSPGNEPGAESTSGRPEIPLVGAGVAPVAGHDERRADPGAPERKRNFQKRLTEKVDQSLKEHPDGSAPPLDRLTQDLDPSKDL
jgi:hypothetical protein